MDFLMEQVKMPTSFRIRSFLLSLFIYVVWCYKLVPFEVVVWICSATINLRLAWILNISMPLRLWTNVAKTRAPNYSMQFSVEMCLHKIYHSNKIKLLPSNQKLYPIGISWQTAGYFHWKLKSYDRYSVHESETENDRPKTENPVHFIQNTEQKSETQFISLTTESRRWITEIRMQFQAMVVICRPLS